MGTMGNDVCFDMITVSHLSKPFEISNQEKSYNQLLYPVQTNPAVFTLN